MRLYTRTGDKGETSVIGGRVSTDDIRVDAFGTVDEANSFVGKAISELKHNDSLFSDIITDLEKIQHELFDCGSDLSTILKDAPMKVTDDLITYLEEKMDEYVDEAPDIEKFILPGGVDASASLHIARTVIRRAERLIVTMKNEGEHVPELVLKYINRLSDYFFAIARVVNYRLDVGDVE